MELKSEVVELRDGRKITVTEANWSADVHLSELERAASKKEEKDPSKQFYIVAVYPKLAACSSGEVPTEEEAFGMPTIEHEKWYAAAKRINPSWFVPMEEAAKKLTDEALKKKETKQTKSTSVSTKS